MPSKKHSSGKYILFFVHLLWKSESESESTLRKIENVECDKQDTQEDASEKGIIDPIDI